MYRGIIYVQSIGMEASSARSYYKNMWIGYKRMITN